MKEFNDFIMTFGLLVAGTLALVFLIVGVAKEIDGQNPCSNFSQRSSECSNIYEVD